MSEKSKAWRKRLRDEDPERYKELKRKERLRYKLARPEVVKGIKARYKRQPSARAGQMRHSKNNQQLVCDWFNDFKAQQHCQVCPETDTCCLEFHHLDPALKLFNLSDCGRRKMRKPIIVAELSKCACVCSNCHKKIHAGRINPVLTLLSI